MPIDLTLIYRVLVFPGFAFIFILTMVCDWISRKIRAHMENRVGPMYTGYHGILQPWADFIKLLAKESTSPKATNKTIFKLMPLLSFSMIMVAMFFMPIDGSNVIPGSAFSGDLILVLMLVTIANFFLFLAGWSSNNPYSKLGGSRVLIQILGYDIPFFLLALTPVFLVGGVDPSSKILVLSFTSIVQGQQSIWFILLIPWSFILFIIAMQAELEKDPFDVPDAETEIVGGLETEYNGASLAFLKFGKDVQVVLGAFIIVDLFLGGPGLTGGITATTGILDLTAFLFTIGFVFKVVAVVVIIQYVASLWARARIDQVLKWNWKYMIPLSIGAMALSLLVAFFWNGLIHF